MYSWCESWGHLSGRPGRDVAPKDSLSVETGPRVSREENTVYP